MASNEVAPTAYPAAVVISTIITIRAFDSSR